MKKLISALILMSSLSAAADTYDCYISYSSGEERDVVAVLTNQMSTSVERSTFPSISRGGKGKIIVSVIDGDKMILGKDGEEQVNPYQDSNIIKVHFLRIKKTRFLEMSAT